MVDSHLLVVQNKFPQAPGSHVAARSGSHPQLLWFAASKKLTELAYQCLAGYRGQCEPLLTFWSNKTSIHHYQPPLVYYSEFTHHSALLTTTKQYEPQLATTMKALFTIIKEASWLRIAESQAWQLHCLGQVVGRYVWGDPSVRLNCSN